MTKKPHAHKPAAPKPPKLKGQPFDPPPTPSAPPTNPAPLIERPPYGGGDEDK